MSVFNCMILLKFILASELGLVETQIPEHDRSPQVCARTLRKRLPSFNTLNNCVSEPLVVYLLNTMEFMTTCLPPCSAPKRFRTKFLAYLWQFYIGAYGVFCFLLLCVVFWFISWKALIWPRLVSDSTIHPPGSSE